MSVMQRLVLAAVLIALLWSVVLWAMSWSGVRRRESAVRTDFFLVPARNH